MEWGIGMFKQYSAQGGFFQRSLMGAALATAAALSACGGGGSGPSTAISGQVVKGPVEGAQVCAFQVVNNAKGPALGSCVSTNAQGSYSLTVPVGSGPVWLEATGGTYVDEATGNPTTLPADIPMLSLVNATGGTAAAMVTPLTTLAVNTARQVAGANAQVDETAVRQAVTQVLQQLSLPLGLDLLATAPVVGNNANEYGQALAAISEMVAQGTPLADVLSSGNAGQFSQAFATAQEAVSGGSGSGEGGDGGSSGPTPPAPVTPSTVSASGSVTVGSGSFSPEATGFEVTVESNMGYDVKYRFYHSSQRVVNNVTITDTQELVVTRSRYNTSPEYTYSFYDSTGTLPSAQCSSACDVVVSTPVGGTHPVTVTLGGTDATEPVRGTLVGDATNALWSFNELPATTTSSLMRNGVNAVVRTVDYSSTAFLTTASIELSNGALLSISQQGSQPATAIYNGDGMGLCISNCGITLSTSNGVTTVSLQGTVVGSSTFQGTVTLDSTRSTLSSPELGTLTAVHDTIKSVNNVRTVTYAADLTLINVDGITSVAVTSRNGVVTRVDVSARQGQSILSRSCGDGLSSLGVSPCSGVSLGADGRTVSFSNTALYASVVGGQPVVAATLNGSVVARGR
ncbi:hypothetical protein EYS42_15525 [Aquabacterium lacunae]|uniref:Uncharacterized protein n=2 Tax=Aquabacterium lacunae TaxID=2528630 RepID=A0A4Q9H1Q9_9BURK|nr:hypothetical protein EYS42_15525 [Aquabacterium lacunae]